MEAKTIGSFIAALRKAQGLTQKELAEKLDVSDKSVSRWERDEGLPDLSLIPVIAEIFGITCDELLRGQRIPAEEQSAPSHKSKKQLQRILLSGMGRFKNRSFIAIGIYILGIIVTLIADFGYGKLLVGALIGCAFYLAGIICQVIFRNQALLCVADSEFNEQDVWRYKERVIKSTQISLGFGVFLAVFSLPFNKILVVLLQNTYARHPWLLFFHMIQNLIYPLIAVGIWYLICCLRNQAMIKNGTIQITQEQTAVRAENRKTKYRCAKWLLIAIAVTLLVQYLLNTFLPVSLFEEPTRTFDDYDSFAAFMERDINSDQEHIRTETLKDNYGNVFCQYELRNFSVAYIEYAGTTDEYLPISVYTEGNMDNYRAKMEVVNICILILYPVEIAVAVFYYFKTRKKEPA